MSFHSLNFFGFLFPPIRYILIISESLLQQSVFVKSHYINTFNLFPLINKVIIISN